jgi:hypothetical protein
MDFLAWSLLAVASLHIIEEFFWPGGFPDWYKRYRPQVASSMTTRFFVVMNAVLLVACALAGIYGMTRRGIGLWLTLAALLAANAWFHLLGTFATREYSPGLITGLALYVPLAIYGYFYALKTGVASLPTAVLAVVIGCSYQLWSNANHRRRAKSGA